jgi:hypothetical protein
LVEESYIELDREVHESFQRSTAVSRKYLILSSLFILFLLNAEAKGSAAHLMKPNSKRRRTKMELSELKEEERIRIERQDRQQQ